MSLKRIILGDLGRLIALIIGFVIYVKYAGIAIDINRALPINNYCQNHHKGDLMCDNEFKYQNFTIIYYDGLGKQFYDRFMNLSKHKNNSLVYQIVHEGLSDSVPAFYTYFSGKLPFNYDVDLKNEDSFFKQLKLSSHNITTFINQQMVNVFDDDLKNANTIEKKGLTYSMSPFFLDWCNMFVYNPSIQSVRVIDNVITDKQEADQFFDNEFEKYTNILNKRKDELFLSLDAYFTTRPRTFIYMPDVDDFSHNVTIQNRNYISSVAALFNNLEALMDYIKQKYPETLIITMSDHGGDESAPQQERYNHETPYNNYGNDPYFSLYSGSLDRKMFNNNIKVKATELSSVLSFMIRHLSLANGFDLAYDIFDNVLMKITYYRAFELKLMKYHKEVLGREINDSIFYKNLAKKMKNMKGHNEKFRREVKNYAEYLLSLSKQVKDKIEYKFKVGINWISLIIAVLTVIIYCIQFLKESISLDYIHQNIEYILFSTLTLYFIITGDINETVFIGFILISFGLMWIKNKKDSYSLPERTFLAAGVLIYILHFIALKYEWFFYNTKNLVSLIITIILMLWNVWSTIRLGYGSKQYQTIISGIVILGMALANIAYDFLSIYQIAYENTTLIDLSRHIFIGCLVTSIALQSISLSLNKPAYLIETTFQFAFYISNPYERFILYLILIPQLNKIRKHYNHLTDNQKRKITYAYTLLGIFIYLASGYYFDWRNRRRLYFKFDIIGFYKPLFLIICLIMSASLEWSKPFIKADFLKPYQFVTGCLLAVVFFNLRFEYRTAVGKLLEFIGFAAFVYFFLVIVRVIEYLREGRYIEKEGAVEFQKIRDLPKSRML